MKRNLRLKAAFYVIKSANFQISKSECKFMKTEAFYKAFVFGSKSV